MDEPFGLDKNLYEYYMELEPSLFAEIIAVTGQWTMIFFEIVLEENLVLCELMMFSPFVPIIYRL